MCSYLVICVGGVGPGKADAAAQAIIAAAAAVAAANSARSQVSLFFHKQPSM